MKAGFEFLRRWLCFCALVSSVAPMLAGGGLTVSPDGQLQRYGRPYRGVGVNYYDAFQRAIEQEYPRDCESGMALLEAREIPFARFSAGGYWPVHWGLYQTNRFDYFAPHGRCGAFRRAASDWADSVVLLEPERHSRPGGEPCSSWGNTNSKVHAFMKSYVREVVSRYRDSAAIWAWEFGNEFNLAADLPNAADHRPPVVPELGTPSVRTAADELTHDQIRVAFAAFAAEVRRLDPERLISSGNAFPGQARGIRRNRNPGTRIRPSNSPKCSATTTRVESTACRFGPTSHRIWNASKPRSGWDGRRKSPRPSGEFGVPGRPLPEQREKFTALLNQLDQAGVNLAALWVYDFNGQVSRLECHRGKCPPGPVGRSGGAESKMEPAEPQNPPLPESK
jgi:hypothetical protein